MNIFSFFCSSILLMCFDGEECRQQKDHAPVSNNVMQEHVKYLALGDSYTIGEAVEVSQRWPMVLGEVMEGSGYQVDIDIVATTGWTTDELMNGIEEATLLAEYDIVSLLIGVNNQYRGKDKGYTLEGYRKEFEELLNKAITFAGGNSKRVFVVSIPDYGVTPFAGDLDSDKIAEELDSYNLMAKEIADAYNVVFYDITPISKEAKENTRLVASDGLHPSGEMYSRWVHEVIAKSFILPIN